MAGLTSGSWTIAFVNGDRNVDTTITSRKKEANLKLTLAAGEFPTAGVTLPGANSCGMIRNLDYIDLIMPRLATASGNIITFSLTTGSRLKVFRNALMSGTGRSIQALATTITVPQQIFYATARGW